MRLACEQAHLRVTRACDKTSRIHCYDSSHLKFFDDITDKYSLSKELDITAKVLFLFNSIDPFVCRLTAAFVFQAMLLRHEISSVKVSFIFILDVVIFSLV